jgi:putative transposase
MQEREYHTDGTYIYSCQYHVIFCPKYRRKVLVDGADVRLKELVLEKQVEYGFTVIEMEVMPDHVHLLIDINPKKREIYRLVNLLKGYTSNVLRKEFPHIKRRIPTLWTHSKFIATVGAVSLDAVKKYIEEQKGK